MNLTAAHIEHARAELWSRQLSMHLAERLLNEGMRKALERRLRYLRDREKRKARAG